jgi:hypothetical protein
MLHAEIGVRHVAGRLLVARGNQRDLVAHLVERVENPDVAVAADAEHERRLLLDQIFGDQLAALHPSHPAPFASQPTGAQASMVTMRSSLISRIA